MKNNWTLQCNYFAYVAIINMRSLKMRSSVRLLRIAASNNYRNCILYNKMRFVKAVRFCKKRGIYSVSFPSPLDRQCCLCLCRSEEHRKRGRGGRMVDFRARLPPLWRVARERSRVTALRGWAFDDGDDKDDTDESSQWDRESFHALVPWKPAA